MGLTGKDFGRVVPPAGAAVPIEKKLVNLEKPCENEPGLVSSKVVAARAREPKMIFFLWFLIVSRNDFPLG